MGKRDKLCLANADDQSSRQIGCASLKSMQALPICFRNAGQAALRNFLKILKGSNHKPLEWWRMQSSETGLQSRNREFSENFRPKQAFGGLSAVGHWKFACDLVQIHGHPSTSCYSAEQAVEARQQAIRCATSGFFEPQTRHNARRLAQVAWAAAPPFVDYEYRW